MILAAFALWAGAQECPLLDEPPDKLSVAWISPVRQTVGGGSLLPVIPSADLREFVSAQRPGIGRLLQRVGMRKRLKDPKRRYKVTLFEVDSAWLCRPLEGADEGFIVDGLPACGRKDAVTPGYSGCGYTTDRKDDGRGFDMYRVRWKDAAARGFCVLPLDRYLAEVPPKS